MDDPPPEIEEGDFELIEAAVRETARGRWFLDEFARRIRSMEMAELVRAIERLDGRAAARQAEDEGAREHIRRIIDLLVPLIDYLETRADSYSADRESETSFPDETASRALLALDALSVADKLKLFR